MTEQLETLKSEVDEVLTASEDNDTISSPTEDKTLIVLNDDCPLYAQKNSKRKSSVLPSGSYYYTDNESEGTRIEIYNEEGNSLGWIDQVIYCSEVSEYFLVKTNSRNLMSVEGDAIPSWTYYVPVRAYPSDDGFLILRINNESNGYVGKVRESDVTRL